MNNQREPGYAGSLVLENVLKFALELPTEYFVLGGVGAFTVIRKGEYRSLDPYFLERFANWRIIKVVTRVEPSSFY